MDAEDSESGEEPVSSEGDPSCWWIWWIKLGSWQPPAPLALRLQPQLRFPARESPCHSCQLTLGRLWVLAIGLPLAQGLMTTVLDGITTPCSALFYLTLGLPGGSDSKESACNVGDLVWSLSQEDPLERGMAIHFSILAWRTPWTEESGWLQFMGLQRVRHNWVTNTPHTLFIYYFKFEDNCFTILCWFAIHQCESDIGICMFPPSWTFLSPPTLYI